MRIGTVLWMAPALLGGTVFAPPASAMTLKECSALYQEAKTAGTLGGLNWTAFRAQRCAGSAGGAQALAAEGAKPAAAPDKAVPLASTAAIDALLPVAPDPKFAREKPSLQRLHTCSQAYRAAKKEGKLQGLRWIERGGGFYSLCTAKLKAAAKG